VCVTGRPASVQLSVRVSPAVNYVAPSYVSMVCSLLMTSGLVMFGRFPVMACGMRQML
jgi:hypothetical protein